jgi:DNA-binding IclR family transcriptional regulator
VVQGVEILERDKRLWKYVAAHKTPISVERLARHFLISKSHAARALNFFADNGLVEVTRHGTTKYYKAKYFAEGP